MQGSCADGQTDTDIRVFQHFMAVQRAYRLLPCPSSGECASAVVAGRWVKKIFNEDITASCNELVCIH